MSVTSAERSTWVDDASSRQGRVPVLFDAPHPAEPATGGVPQPVLLPRRALPVSRRTASSDHRRSVSPPSPPVPQAAKDLLIDAARGLGRAIRSTAAADRYAAAHLAALRGAAAVLAARARPVRGRRGSAWELMSKVAPEFAEWAAFFAAGSAKRQAAEAGLSRLITAREADDMVRQVTAFLDLVEEALEPVGSRRSAAR